MKIIIRNILAVLVGVVAGSVVNMGIILSSGHIIPPPDGADVTTAEGLKDAIHLFQPKHFLFPFLAHALGTFMGAWIASIIALSHRIIFALTIGMVFLVGGTINAFMIPAPLWFVVTDLAAAYIPMAYFGYLLSFRK